VSFLVKASDGLRCSWNIKDSNKKTLLVAKLVIVCSCFFFSLHSMLLNENEDDKDLFLFFSFVCRRQRCHQRALNLRIIRNLGKYPFLLQSRHFLPFDTVSGNKSLDGTTTKNHNNNSLEGGWINLRKEKNKNNYCMAIR
jgi:hypothetical protein